MLSYLLHDFIIEKHIKRALEEKELLKKISATAIYQLIT